MSAGLPNNLDHFKIAFNSIGWCIPPYVTFGFMSQLTRTIRDKKSFDQSDLEELLALVYTPETLAPMVTERYPETPFVQDYRIIISEAIEAHFMGLDHVAVAGILPVIEGAACKLANRRSVSSKGMKNLFINLATHCRNDVISNNIGRVGEIVSMLDSFIEFASSHLYTNSGAYVFSDKTNRHGILHGAYTDGDYGQPLNFYKAISAVDVLCFLVALRENISWNAPAPSESANALASYYGLCMAIAKGRPKT